MDQLTSVTSNAQLRDFCNQFSTDSYFTFVEEKTKSIQGYTVADEVSFSENLIADKITIQPAHITVPLILVVGLIGNLVTMSVMQRKSFEKHLFRYMITALAVSDSVLVILAPFNKMFVIEWLGFDFRSYSQLTCKTFFWFWRNAKMTSSWFIVLVSIERFIAVWFPFKSRQLVTKQFFWFSILLNYVMAATFNTIWVYLTDSVVNGTCQVNKSLNGNVKMEQFFVILGTCLYSIVPSILIVCLNTLTIRRLVNQRKSLVQVTSKSNKAKETSMITIMLACNSLAFVMLVVPITLMHCYALFTGSSDLYTSKEPITATMREITQTLEQLNYAINFILYSACSTTFRKEVLSTVSCLRRQ